MDSCKDQNQILLRGTVSGPPRFSHISHQERFYLFPLTVERLSGNEDVLNIQLPGRLLDQSPPEPGAAVEVTGSLRTFNNRSGEGARLVITVLADGVRPTGEPPANLLTLRGTICRRDEVRRTPLGREICDFTLAVNRRYGRSDYLPCIAWGSMAQRCAALGVGSRLELTGRLQSRSYTKQYPDRREERVAYECSAMSLEPEAAEEPWRGKGVAAEAGKG